MNEPIESFSGEHRFLSNFAYVRVRYDEENYPTVENAFQAAKTLDLKARDEIRFATPGHAKGLGQKVKLRDNWEELKIPIMSNLLKRKFEVPSMKEQLLATGDRTLIEGNTWGDTFWGVCEGEGTNHLGRLLMKVRNDLKRTTVEIDEVVKLVKSRSLYEYDLGTMIDVKELLEEIEKLRMT